MKVFRSQSTRKMFAAVRRIFGSKLRSKREIPAPGWYFFRYFSDLSAERQPRNAAPGPRVVTAAPDARRSAIR